ncbi:hypothetical protein JW998_10640 [candidate division KSB1 bacterium]|nr:hypothetical protein [candidate division KSB1 bacterium]
MRRTTIFIFLCLASLFFPGFFCLFTLTKPYRFDEQTTAATITSPTKIHLADGSMIVFAEGFTMTADSIAGNGTRYDLTRERAQPVQTLARDSVMFMEYYTKKLQTGPFLGGLAAPLLFIAAVQNEDIHKAFFGSCPTVYSYDGEHYALEAECFSYSISPKIETFDLDRIEYGQTCDGQFILNVRNEALETHYINQMQLVVVDHPPEYEPFPLNRPFMGRKDRTILFGAASDILEATSKSGRDVRALLSERDHQWYQSDAAAVQKMTAGVEKDWLDISVAVPPEARNMVIALRFRNTLFYTVEFYDVLLDGYGARGIDWMACK